MILAGWLDQTGLPRCLLQSPEGTRRDPTGRATYLQMHQMQTPGFLRINYRPACLSLHLQTAIQTLTENQRANPVGGDGERARGRAHDMFMKIPTKQYATTMKRFTANRPFHTVAAAQTRYASGRASPRIPSTAVLVTAALNSSCSATRPACDTCQRGRQPVPTAAFGALTCLHLRPSRDCLDSGSSSFPRGHRRRQRRRGRRIRAGGSRRGVGGDGAT